jgi:ribokinase
LVFLNAAPVRELDPELMSEVDVLVLNQHEDLAYQSPSTGLVVVSAGAGEAVVRRAGQVVARATPPQVAVVDTVGAGDTFTAAFAVALARGLNPQQALSRAVVAGALATTAPGAQAAMPTAQQVDRALAH